MKNKEVIKINGNTEATIYKINDEWRWTVTKYTTENVEVNGWFVMEDKKEVTKSDSGFSTKDEAIKNLAEHLK